MPCRRDFTTGRVVTGETRTESKRDEKEQYESAINKSRVIYKTRKRKENEKESKGEEIA